MPEIHFVDKIRLKREKTRTEHISALTDKHGMLRGKQELTRKLTAEINLVITFFEENNGFGVNANVFVRDETELKAKVARLYQDGKTDDAIKLLNAFLVKLYSVIKSNSALTDDFRESLEEESEK